MVNLDKLKRKSRLPAPPSADEATGNIFTPEFAPAAPVEPTNAANENIQESRVEPEAQDVTRTVARTPRLLKVQDPEEALTDGRSLRKTGRTISFATRVSPQFRQRLLRAAKRDNKLIVEVLEEALEAYEARNR